jgi:hypothetical protein
LAGSENPENATGCARKISTTLGIVQGKSAEPYKFSTEKLNTARRSAQKTGCPLNLLVKKVKHRYNFWRGDSDRRFDFSAENLRR